MLYEESVSFEASFAAASNVDLHLPTADSGALTSRDHDPEAHPSEGAYDGEADEQRHEKQDDQPDGHHRVNRDEERKHELEVDHPMGADAVSEGALTEPAQISTVQDGESLVPQVGAPAVESLPIST